MSIPPRLIPGSLCEKPHPPGPGSVIMAVLIMRLQPANLLCFLVMTISPLATGGSFGDAPGNARESLIRQIPDPDPVEPSARRIDGPVDLNALIMAMLNKDTNRRPDGEELMHRLTRLAAEAA